MKGIIRFSRKGLVALVAALCLLLPLCAQAAQIPTTVVTAQWTDEYGYPQSAEAVEITYAGYENRFWITVPAEAL